VNQSSTDTAPAIMGPLSVNYAALQNLTPELFATLTKLKLSVVIVQFAGVNLDHPAMKCGEIARKLGQQLEQAGAGFFDASAHLATGHWHFFHCGNVAKAIPALKAGLERRGLLAHSEILTAESPTDLLTWHPPTAKKLSLAE